MRTPVNQNEAFSPRHTRKILESLSGEGAESLINRNLPVITDQKPSPEIFAEESRNPSSNEPVLPITTSKPMEATRETHIMNLWRSSKRKSPASRRKRN